MKKMKKLLSLVLATVMVLALGMTVSAEETKYKITAPANTHTYNIYQIFTGDLSDGKLSNVKWGKSGTGTEGATVDADIINKLTEVNSLSDSAMLEVILKYVAKDNDGNLDTSKILGSVTNESSLDVSAGYYLIQDYSSTAIENDVFSTYIVKVSSDFTIEPKAEIPSVDKKVQDETGDSETGADSDGWGESADHAINETFKFKLIANLPEEIDYAQYKTYKVVFNDTMSAGVTFEEIVSVTVDGVSVDEYDETDNPYGYKMSDIDSTASDGSQTFTITFDDIKKISNVDLTNGAKIEVIYEAHLNEKAQVDKTDVTSTTNKNEVYLEYSNNPYTDGTGTTEKDYVWLFTYEVDNTKRADSKTGTVLEDAGFKLYKEDETTEIELIYDREKGAYRPVNTDDGEEGEEMLSNADGVFNIIGLDAGTYVLKETTTPTGYNTCEPITITIKATHSENTGGASASMTLDESSTITNTIINKSGTTLPETGGIGTTIFYVVGAILMIGAGVILVARRRTNR